MNDPRPVNARLKVLLVEDHETVRAGLRLIIDGQGDMAVVGEAQDGTAALTTARAVQPDVVVMDVSMPGMNGLEATRVLRDAQPAAYHEHRSGRLQRLARTGRERRPSAAGIA